MNRHKVGAGSRKLNVAIVGRFQIGKSTLVNCLLDDRVTCTGNGISTTKIPAVYTYGQIPVIHVTRTGGDPRNGWEPTDFRLRDFVEPEKEKWEDVYGVWVSLWKPLLQRINLIDTPGFDANADDTAKAVSSLDAADFVIVLLESRGVCEVERNLLAEISRRQLPFAVIVNCRDRDGERWFPENNGEIVREISADLCNHGRVPQAISGNMVVWPCNLLWFWHASEHIFEDPDGVKFSAYIEEYMQMHLNQKATSLLTFLKSNFLPVRRFIESLNF